MRAIRSLLISSIAFALCGCWLPHKRWINHTETIPLGADGKTVVHDFGKPDYVLSMPEFVSRLDASPATYTAVNGDSFPSYRDFVMSEMRSSSLDADTLGTDWYNSPYYAKYRLFIYDESCRYTKPYFGTWFCIVAGFYDGHVVRKFIIHCWEPGKWAKPSAPLLR